MTFDALPSVSRLSYSRAPRAALLLVCVLCGGVGAYDAAAQSSAPTTSAPSPPPPSVPTRTTATARPSAAPGATPDSQDNSWGDLPPPDAAPAANDPLPHPASDEPPPPFSDEAPSDSGAYPPPPGYQPPGTLAAAAPAPSPVAPPPPQEPAPSSFEFPAISVRLDPFNWLISGQLGLELEVGLWQFLSLELVPVFLTTSDPFDLDDRVSQHSDGLGALAGSSVGLGFWLEGTPFRGYVLRALLTNYSVEYRVADALTRAGGSPVDSARHTERRLIGMLGSLSRYGAFTLGGGIGIGYELNREERCVFGPPLDAERSCDEPTFQIGLDRDGASALDLNGFLYPYSIEARVSIGVTID